MRSGLWKEHLVRQRSWPPVLEKLAEPFQQRAISLAPLLQRLFHVPHLLQSSLRTADDEMVSMGNIASPCFLSIYPTQICEDPHDAVVPLDKFELYQIVIAAHILKRPKSRKSENDSH